MGLSCTQEECNCQRSGQLVVSEPPEEANFLQNSAAYGREVDSGCRIAQTEFRAIQFGQLKELGFNQICTRCECEGWMSTNPSQPHSRLTAEMVTLYDASELIVIPATSHRECSFVELLATAPQEPVWFTSHWWGSPVLSFVRCVAQHVEDHLLKDDTTYWVCGYAINQHKITVDGGISANPIESAFVKAIELAQGRVLCIMDEEGTVYTRIWCCLESFICLRRERDGFSGRYEVYTAKSGCDAYAVVSFIKTNNTTLSSAMHAALKGEKITIPIENRNAVGITNGTCPADYGWPAIKNMREASFPATLANQSQDICIEEANATVDDDKKHILNYIAERDLELEPLTSHARYDQTNKLLQGKYAAAMWRRLLEAGEDMQMCASKLRFSGLRRLSFSFHNCRQFNDEALELLLKNLPSSPPLVDLRLDLSQSRVTPNAFNRQHPAMLLCDRRLRAFFLDGCPAPNGLSMLEHATAWADELEYFSSEAGRLTGSLPAAIGQYSKLRLLYLGHNQLTGIIPKEIGQCVNLEWVYLQGNQLTGVIPSTIGNCTQLLALRLSDNDLQGMIPATLGRCIKLFTLDLSSNRRLEGPIPHEVLQLESSQLEWLGVDKCPDLNVGDAFRHAPGRETPRNIRAAYEKRNTWQA